MGHRTLSLSQVPPPDRGPWWLRPPTPPRGKSLGQVLWRHNLANPWAGSTCRVEVRVQIIPGGSRARTDHQLEGEPSPWRRSTASSHRTSPNGSAEVHADRKLAARGWRGSGPCGRRGRAPRCRRWAWHSTHPGDPLRPCGKEVSSPGHWAAVSRGLGPGVTENGWGHEVFRYRARAEEPCSVAAAQTETSPERAS